MRIDLRGAARMIVMAVWAAFFVYLAASGEMSRYLGPRTYWVVVFGAVALVAVLVMHLVAPQAGRRESPSLRESLATLVLLAPLVALWIAPKPDLGALAAANRSQPAGAMSASSLVPAPEEGRLSFIDVHFANESESYAAKAGVLPGVAIELTGFVSERYSGSDDTFELSRFYVSCCAADAFPYTVTVRPVSLRNQLDEDTWVRIAGTLERTTGGFVVVARQTQPVSEPDDPYLY